MNPNKEPSRPDEQQEDDAYEPPRLESHGKLADITGTRQGSGADLSEGTRGTGD